MDDSSQHGDGIGDIDPGDQDCDPVGETSAQPVVAGMGEAEGLGEAPDTVPEMKAQAKLSHDIEDRRGRHLETGDEILVGVARNEMGMGRNIGRNCRPALCTAH